MVIIKTAVTAIVNGGFLRQLKMTAKTQNRSNGCEL